MLAELDALGIQGATSTKGGVRVALTLPQAYEACLWLRTASRVLWPIHAFEASDAEALYAGARSVNWSSHIASDASVAVAAQGTTGDLADPRFSALKIKDALVDQLREQTGRRPTVDAKAPDVQIRARLHRRRAHLFVDLSGDPLHRRGYRTEAGPAPLRETAASAMLLRARWPSMAAAGAPLVDPMCGAGTLLVEGAWMALDIAPGLLRTRWGFDAWLGHDATAWHQARERARARGVSGGSRALVCVGFDADARVLEAARGNLARAGLDGLVKLQTRDVQEVEAPTAGDVDVPGLVVVNPPYGARLGDTDEALQTYTELGDTLRRAFVGWRAAVLAGDKGHGVRLGLRAARKNVLHNGPIRCDLLHLEISEAQVEAAAQRRARWHEEVDHTPVAQRLRKNLRRLKSWRSKARPDCYRVYDADIPEFNAAIDRYLDHVVVFEYEAPASVPRALASARLDAIVRAASEVFESPSEKVVVKRRRRQRGSSQYQRIERQNQTMEVREGDVRLLVNLHDYLDTGLFLDHRPIRAWIGEHARGTRFLNLFCYTGTATAHAAVGGARATTSVDLSQRYLDWAADNLRLNGCSPRANALIRADVMAWIDEAAERGRRWDLLFVDPPTFSNSKSMKDTFDVQRDHLGMLHGLRALCTEDATLIFSCNRRKFRLDPAVTDHFEVEDVTEWSLPPDYPRARPAHRCFMLRPRAR